MTLNDGSMLDPLDRFRIDVNPDRNLDPYLICEDCGLQICTVEHDDTIAVLVRTALSHIPGECAEAQRKEKA